MAAALALSAAAFCSDAGGSQGVWRWIGVRFTVDEKGALHISERADIVVPADAATLERRYWSDREKRVAFDGIVRVDKDGKEIRLTRGNLDRADHFDVPYDGVIRWSTRDKESSGDAAQRTYIIDSTITGAVIPAWSMRQGRYSWTGASPFASVSDRLNSFLESAQNLRNKPRYLLDYALMLPPAGSEGLKYDAWLDFDQRAWRPLQPVTAGNLGQFINSDGETPAAFRLTHSIDFTGPGVPLAIPMESHVQRAGALVALPVAGVAIWLLAIAVAVLRGGRGSEAVDDEWLRTHLSANPPEVVGARWSGSSASPALEVFLRRLEKERKLSIRLQEIPVPPEEADDDDQPGHIVHLRLLVPRDQLSPYERQVINALMTDRQEITSTEIQKKYEGQVFDPSDEIDAALRTIAGDARSRSGSPWYWRFFVFALFAAGIVLIARDTLVTNAAPVAVIGALFFGAGLTAMWPDSVARYAMQHIVAGAIVLLIPLLLVVAAGAMLHLTSEQPLGLQATAGVTLAMLALYAAIAVSASRQPFPDLQKARNYFAAQLAGNRALRTDYVPYAAALGLPVQPLKEPEEEWGIELMVI